MRYKSFIKLPLDEADASGLKLTNYLFPDARGSRSFANRFSLALAATTILLSQFKAVAATTILLSQFEAVAATTILLSQFEAE